MPALAASDVTVTINRKEDLNGMKRNYCTVSFGDGSLTYPATGVPLAKGKLGMARHLEHVAITEDGTLSYKTNYDISAETIVLGQGDYTNTTDGPLIVLTTSDAPAAQVVRMVVDGY